MKIDLIPCNPPSNSIISPLKTTIPRPITSPLISKINTCPHHNLPHHNISHYNAHKNKPSPHKLHLNNKGVLDEPLDIIVLIIGGIVLFAVLSLVISQGKDTIKEKSTDLVTRTNMMNSKLTEWKLVLEEGETLKAQTRLERELKIISNTGLDPSSDPLQKQPNSPEEAKPGYKS